MQKHENRAIKGDRTVLIQRVLFSGPIWVFSALLLLQSFASAQADEQDSAAPSDRLADRLQPFLRAISGTLDHYEIRGRVDFPIDGESQSATIRMARFGDESFDLDLDHADYAVSIRRREHETAFALPKHNVVFVGDGEVDPADRLTPRGISRRFITTRSSLSIYAPMILQPDATMASALLTSLLGATFDPHSDQGRVGQDASFRFERDGSLAVDLKQIHLRLSVTSEPATAAVVDDWPGMRVVGIARDELERQLSRGVRRAFEILAPSKMLTNPSQRGKTVAHGELRWIEGQRVVLLEGSPEEIGRAHAELLTSEARACIDSVLYTFGTAQTIRSGRWFRHDLDSAYARLSSHIPERHRAETRAMGRALGLDEQLVDALNVFPEMFHCSGFAVFGTATSDGKLYHGRVLDYMTTIGLQDAATTFVVKADGQIPFVNVGYAGFTGSVSGMNAQAISLGEMGGGGEGKWDGVPMSTLMRRALEECTTLDEVIDLWSNNPRTCEYFYVFADGKTNRAVGVAALPESIEFIQPGQSDPRLGDGIKDAVVLSAGSRLEKLRQRVQEKHGQIDATIGKWLMNRPVAMQSNLHNVLFVPEDGVLYVANADHQHPAAERPYVRLDLHELLRSMNRPASQQALSQTSK
jgi:hypothetical protein